MGWECIIPPLPRMASLTKYNENYFFTPLRSIACWFNVVIVCISMGTVRMCIALYFIFTQVTSETISVFKADDDSLKSTTWKGAKLKTPYSQPLKDISDFTTSTLRNTTLCYFLLPLRQQYNGPEIAARFSSFKSLTTSLFNQTGRYIGSGNPVSYRF